MSKEPRYGEFGDVFRKGHSTVLFLGPSERGLWSGIEVEGRRADISIGDVCSTGSMTDGSTSAMPCRTQLEE